MRRILQRNFAQLSLIFLAMQLNLKAFSQVTVGNTYQMVNQHALGGNLINALGYNVHTFLKTDSLIVPAGFSSANVEVLIVGGGGGGGFYNGGGGGAGGLIDTPNCIINKSMAIYIGAGGGGAFFSFFGTGFHGTRTDFGTGGIGAEGGGGGADDQNNGGNGASGGGGSNGKLGGNTLFYTFGQGNKGGDQNNGLGCCHNAGAGGGGAAFAGQNTAADDGSNGGNGTALKISGTLLYYSGGGGGGYGSNKEYTGGLGGGGKGGSSINLNGTNGTANTGGGGGGGGSNNLQQGSGGSGGSGIVIIKYPYGASGTWTSNNTAIATVDPITGIVSGKAYGNTNIIYTVTTDLMTSTYTQPLSVTYPLPVSLLYFETTYNSCTVNILWKTTSEINSSYYIIESGKDGNVFTQIAKLTSMNQISGSSYSQTITNVTAGMVYYRLKMVDTDGKFTYSKVVHINSTDICNTIAPVSIRPNPATDFILVDGLTKGNQLSLFNAAGIKLVSLKINSNATRININKYPSGVYILRVENANGTVQTLKVIKK